MKHVKLYCVLIIGLLLCAGPIQTFAQEPTASKEQRDEIQKAIDDVNKAIKEKGKDDPSIKELAKKAIDLADKYYKINTPDNVDGGEAEYDPGVGGEGVTHPNGKKAKVKVGPKAFTTPGWLASTKLHEFVHATQLADGRWVIPETPAVPDDWDGVPGNTDDEKFKYLEDLKNKLKALLEKLTKSRNINETEAYDKEVENAKKTGLSPEELADVEKRRKSHFDSLDAANQKKINDEQTAGETYKTAMLRSTGKSMFVLTRNSELYVAGSVLSEERMQVTFRGTSTQAVEGNVVTAELVGKTTQAKTDKEGHAILDISEIAGGLVGTAVATITVFDSKGNQISTANTTVEQGHPMIFDRPQIGRLPDNIPGSEVVTIPGKNLGADAHLVLGEQFQETLSASDKELTVFTDCKPGTQPAYVVTASGVSQSQTVNVYSIDFSLPKSSITPKEVVMAQVHFESIPVGTKLIFTNISPETIKMSIPGGQNAANECIYTVTEPNGTIPVNITGRTRGGFKISLNTEFKNGNQTPR
jgi:hypothetical protein